jgi:hypothetical protein
VVGRIKDIRVLETGLGGTDWVDLAQDREQWRAIAKTV